MWRYLIGLERAHFEGRIIAQGLLCVNYVEKKIKRQPTYGCLPTILTCDQYAHHVVDGHFLNANNSINKDLGVWNPRRSDEEDMVITSSDSTLKSLFLKLFAFRKSVHHDVMGTLVTSESSWSIATTATRRRGLSKNLGVLSSLITMVDQLRIASSCVLLFS